MDKNSIGAQAESHVAELYIKNGYKILSRNFRTRFGEVDLIAKKELTVAVVEVKARAQSSLVPIQEVVDREKCRKIRTTAITFLQKNRLLEHTIRFDVALVSYNGNLDMNCEVIYDAFE